MEPNDWWWVPTLSLFLSACSHANSILLKYRWKEWNRWRMSQTHQTPWILVGRNQTQKEVLFTWYLVRVTDSLPNSLTLLKVTATGEQMKENIPSNQITDFLSWKHDSLTFIFFMLELPLEPIIQSNCIVVDRLHVITFHFSHVSSSAVMIQITSVWSGEVWRCQIYIQQRCLL